MLEHLLSLYATIILASHPPQKCVEPKHETAQDAWTRQLLEDEARWETQVLEDQLRWDREVQESQEIFNRLEEEANRQFEELDQELDGFRQSLDLLRRSSIRRSYTLHPKQQDEVKSSPHAKEEVPRDAHNREQSRLEQLMYAQTLTHKEFKELIDMTNTISEYIMIRNARGIVAPDKTTAAYQSSKQKLYGSPLETHKQGYGVCDEFSLHFAAFFAGKKGYEVYLFEFVPEKGNSHAVTVYEDPHGNWGFQSNNFITTGGMYDTKEEAVEGAVLESMKERPTKVYERRISPGKWIYDNKESRKLRPKKKYPFPKEAPYRQQRYHPKPMPL